MTECRACLKGIAPHQNQKFQCKESLPLDNTILGLEKQKTGGLIRECEVLSNPFPGTQRIPIGSSQLDALGNKSDTSSQGT